MIASDRFYHVANAGRADLGSYTIAANGTPSLLAAVTAKTGTGSIDLTASANWKYLYAEAEGAVFEFQINSSGSLNPIGSGTGSDANIEGIAVD